MLITAWKTSCTRIFFPNEDVLQPSFVAPGNWNICYSCATTCHLPNSVTPNRDPKLKFRCMCALIPGKECLYSARYSNLYMYTLEEVTYLLFLLCYFAILFYFLAFLLFFVYRSTVGLEAVVGKLKNLVIEDLEMAKL